jgi:hypothetical protein
MTFSKRVLAEVKARLKDLAASVELAQASLESPSDGDDAEQILALLDELRMDSQFLLSLWIDEQYRCWPETQVSDDPRRS